MIRKYIDTGDKVELHALNAASFGRTQDGEVTKKTYRTIVFDVVSDDEIELEMPMEKTRLVLLPVGGTFDLFFYCEKGLYQCFAKVTDRYKKENRYVIKMELTSNLRRHQRREYYRFSCILEMGTRSLNEEEVKAVERADNLIIPDLPLQKSVIVDISGGGLRFIANQEYPKDELVYCKYKLLLDGQFKEYDIVGKILLSKKIVNRPGSFEHRVQYVNLDNNTREEIIRYIFEEERKNRKKEKG